jgi:predicted Rossmann fold nucleotide-binding protein DprA/Smf involved in DNA uptake
VPYLVLEDLLAHYPEAVDAKSPEGKPAPKVKELPVAPPGLGAAETRIFEILAGGPKLTDDLILASELAAHAVLASLSTLELLGLAVQERGFFRIT